MRIRQKNRSHQDAGDIFPAYLIGAGRKRQSLHGAGDQPARNRTVCPGEVLDQTPGGHRQDTAGGVHRQMVDGAGAFHFRIPACAGQEKGPPFGDAGRNAESGVVAVGRRQRHRIIENAAVPDFQHPAAGGVGVHRQAAPTEGERNRAAIQSHRNLAGMGGQTYHRPRDVLPLQGEAIPGRQFMCRRRQRQVEVMADGRGCGAGPHNGRQTQQRSPGSQNGTQGVWW
jgi:hypothetical protein